jgi:integrase
MPPYARRELVELLNTKTGCFKRELTVSLQTKDNAEGKRRDLRQGTRVADLFAAAELLITNGQPQSADGGAIDLAELQSFVVAELLAADAAEREEGDDRRRLQTAEDRARWPDLVAVPDANAKGMAEDHLAAYGSTLDELQTDYRNAFARRDPKIVDAELRAHLKRLGVRIDPAAPKYRDAGLAVLQAHVKAYDLMQSRQAGDDVPTPEARVAKRGIGVVEAFEAWQRGSPARGSKKPSPNTVREATHAVRRFKEMFGDAPLSSITRENVRTFRDALARVPTRLPMRLRKLAIQNVLAVPEIASLPPPHIGTINKTLTLLSAIVSNAEREGMMDAWPSFVNPFGKGLKLSADAREADRRAGFTAADLTAIFGTPVYAHNDRPRGGGGEAAYWLPIIALYSGARQGELAQLRIEDLKLDPETAVWFFDISTQGGRSIKTASAKRKVPVHPALQSIGLLRYRQSLLDLGADLQAPLWPDVKSDNLGRRAGPWSKWFNRYLRDTANVSGAGKVFHSFRHTFKRMARDAGLPEEMHDALTGHAGGGVGRSYGGGFGLKALAEAMQRIPAPSGAQSLIWRQVGYPSEVNT